MILQRRQNYLNKANKQSISVFYSGEAKHKSNDQYFPFSVNRNFFYLSNINQANVTLVIVNGKNKSDSFLFIESVDPIKALWDGATLTFEEASKLSEIPLTNIMPIEEVNQFLNNLLGISRRASFGLIDSLYFDLENQGANEYLTNTQNKANAFKAKYPSINVNNSESILASLRMVKDELEVNYTKEAIEVTKTALEHVLTKLRPNVSEAVVEAEYNYILNINGTTTSFDTIAASGKNGTILHYVDNNANINDGDLILFDLGALNNYYCSDISRTYPANGKFSDRQKEIYEIVLEANKKTIAWLKAGRTIKEFNDYGKNILIEGLKRIGLIEDDSEITKYYYHSLGHYLGLDVHDVGLYDEVIPEGAIITVEPGLYIAQESIGIRIEDNILITKDGGINLSQSIIKEVDEIEGFMAKHK